MRNILFTVALTASLAIFAVASTQDHQTGPQPQMPIMSMNPMNVPGTDLSVTDTKDGITLTITTKDGDVGDLRRRAENMAKMHGASSDMHGGMMAFSVKYEEVPNGARLTLTPKDPAQLEEFRANVRQHAEQMKKGECSMMQGMMGGMKNSEPAPKPEEKRKTDESDHSAHHPPGDQK